MWIKMLRDQVTPWGPLQKGQTHSLTPAMIKKLADDSYERVEIDETAIERMGVEDRRKHLTAEIAMLDSSIESASQRLGDLKQRRKPLRDKLKQANEELLRIEANSEDAKDDGQSDAGEPAADAAGPPKDN